MNLCSFYFGTGCDIYVDRYVFCISGLVCNLLHQNFTLVGTVLANRHEVPSPIKSTRREVESTEALYEHSNKILLLPYVPKRNKNILMISSLHSFVSITDSHKKPAVIMDHKKHKSEADTLDKTVKNLFASGKQIAGQLLSIII